MSAIRQQSWKVAQSLHTSLLSGSRGLSILTGRDISTPTHQSPLQNVLLRHNYSTVLFPCSLAPKYHCPHSHGSFSQGNQRCLSTSALAADTPAPAKSVKNSTLSDLTAGGRKYRHRRARGGGDKQAGRGSNGQKSRRGTGSPALFFEGGQTPLWKRLPRRGFHNRFSYTYSPITLARLSTAIRAGKLDPRNVITMKHLYDAGLIRKAAYNTNGVYLINSRPPMAKFIRQLPVKPSGDVPVNMSQAEEGWGGRPAPWFDIPIKLEVANISASAKLAIEQAGGDVTKVFYNKLGIRALLQPLWFAKKGRLLPNAVQMVPYKKAWRYDRVGFLPPPESVIPFMRLPEPATKPVYWGWKKRLNESGASSTV